jgi:hypothetical protein
MVVVLLAASPALADEVFLKGGGRITGQIVERAAESVTVDIGGGTFTVRVESIVRIEEGRSPLQEYRERAARLPDGDAEGWRELARWATGRALGTMAGQAWSHVAAVRPDDEEANLALGRVRFDGRWVTEEESYRAQGYVEFEGDWMRPEERQAILAERQASEEAHRSAVDAQVEADRKERQASEAREEEERQAFLRGGFAQGSDIVTWESGYAPPLWPSTPSLPTRPGQPAGGAQ